MCSQKSWKDPGFPGPGKHPGPSHHFRSPLYCGTLLVGWASFRENAAAKLSSYVTFIDLIKAFVVWFGLFFFNSLGCEKTSVKLWISNQAFYRIVLWWPDNSWKILFIVTKDSVLIPTVFSFSFVGCANGRIVEGLTEKCLFCFVPMKNHSTCNSPTLLCKWKIHWSFCF